MKNTKNKIADKKVLIISSEEAFCENMDGLFNCKSNLLEDFCHYIVADYSIADSHLNESQTTSPNNKKSLLASDDIRLTSCSAVVVTAPDFSMELMLFLKKHADANMAILVVTSDEKTLNLCRREHKHIITLNGELTSEKLANSLNMVIKMAEMAQSMCEMTVTTKLAEQRFVDIADNFADWLWEIDKNLNVIFSAGNSPDYGDFEVGTAFHECFAVGEYAMIKAFLEKNAQSFSSFNDLEIWSKNKHNCRTCWNLSAVPIWDKNDEFAGYRGIGKDISPLKSMGEQLQYLSDYDSLTGLFNRERFTEELNRKLRKYKRSNNQGALVLIDIDHFKHVNDSYGFDVGDKLVVNVAQIIKDAVRGEDFVARLGADEFAVIMQNADSNNIESRSSYIIEAIHKATFVTEDATLSVSASGGVAMFPAHGDTVDELLTKANVAIRQAKHNGQNRLEIFTEEQLRKYDDSRRLEWVSYISHCVEEAPERFELHFQPIVSLKNSNKSNKIAIEHYEVLVRLRDEDEDLISPVKFIEIAEDFGIIGKIDVIIAEHAIDILEMWQKKMRNITFSINISGRTFGDSEAMQRIIEKIKKSNIKKGSLVIEITETTILHDMSKVRRMIAELKKSGVLLALDDCGVGYSSFNHIRQLDIDYIKIDGSFIRDLHRNREDETFVKALRDVARSMHILTVAEMVEEPETVIRLKELGIDYAQGYHFAMPKPDLPKEFNLIQAKVG